MSETTLERSVAALEDRSRIAAGAVVIAALGLALLGGVVGVLAGVATLVVWWYTPGPYAVGVGQFGLVAVAPADALFPILVVELALLGVLVGPDVEAERGQVNAPARVAPATVGITSVLGLIALGALWTVEAVWSGALVLVLTAVLAGYAVHRYELVALGMVTHDEH